jgi:hypothetical protein
MHQSIYLISVPGYSPYWHPLGIAQIKTQVEHLTEGNVKAGFWSSEFASHIRQLNPHLADILYDMSETGTNYHEMFFAAKLFGHTSEREIIQSSLENEFNGRDVFRNRFYKPTKYNINKGFKYYLRCVLELCNILNLFLRHKIKQLIGANYTVIGFSCLSCQLLTSIYVIKELRKLGYKGQIWVGGSAIQEWNQRDLHALFPYVDKFVIGKGTQEFLRFCGRHNDADVIRYLKKGESLLGDFSDMPKSVLRDKNFRIPIQLHGGCSWARCKFCTAHSTLSEEVNPDLLVNWIHKISKRYNHRSFGFTDPNLNCNPNTFDAFLKRMTQLITKTKFEYDLYGMLNTVDLNKARISDMQAVGFQNILLGVEHFSDSALNRMDKEASTMDNLQAIKWFCEQRFPKIVFNVIIDYPNSTLAEAKEAYYVMQRIQHLIISSNISLSIIEFEMQRNSRVFDDVGKFSGECSFKADTNLFPESIAHKLRFFTIKHLRGVIKGRETWKKIDKLVNQNKTKYFCYHQHVRDEMIVTHFDGKKRYRYIFDGWKRKIYDLISSKYCSVLHIIEISGQPRKKVNAFLLFLVEKRLAIILGKNVIALSIERTRSRT